MRRSSFDGALLLWHTLGFVGRADDVQTIEGLMDVVRPGGRVVLDLFHPEWLRRHERTGEPDPRGAASVRRWMRDARCFHEIKYADSVVDDIQFDVYEPEEIRAVAARIGFEAMPAMASWDPGSPPSAEVPRFQLVCDRP
jgi:hypothetical protein